MRDLPSTFAQYLNEAPRKATPIYLPGMFIFWFHIQIQFETHYRHKKAKRIDNLDKSLLKSYKKLKIIGGCLQLTIDLHITRFLPQVVHIFALNYL